MFIEMGLGVAATLTAELLIAHFFLWKNTSNTTSGFRTLLKDVEGGVTKIEDEVKSSEQFFANLLHKAKATPVPDTSVPTNVNPAG